MEVTLNIYPTEGRLNYVVLKIEQEVYKCEQFPLYAAIEKHLKHYGIETKGAKIYEVVEDVKYIHLATLNT